MKIAMPKLIADPYDWLPGYGESNVSYRSHGLDVILDVVYEKALVDENMDKNIVVRRELLFKGVRYFVREPLASSLFFEFDGDPKEFRVGALTEFENSGLADASRKLRQSLFGDEISRLRHFTIQFLSENIAFHILASDVLISLELPMIE